jgi:hypothetical protein
MGCPSFNIISKIRYFILNNEIMEMNKKRGESSPSPLSL